MARDLFSQIINRKATPKPPASGPEQVMQLWNERTQAPIPRCRELTAKRRKQIEARLKERPISEWQEVATKIAASTFCQGQNDRGWKATFDWMIGSPDVAVKVLEGRVTIARRIINRAMGIAPAGNSVCGRSGWRKSKTWRLIVTEELDKCEICHGARGGVPGNENVIEGGSGPVIMCDYCHAEWLSFYQVEVPKDEE